MPITLSYLQDELETNRVLLSHCNRMLDRGEQVDKWGRDLYELRQGYQAQVNWLNMQILAMQQEENHADSHCG